MVPSSSATGPVTNHARPQQDARPPSTNRSVSLRISVTDRCQQRCVYCMPAGGVAKLSHADVLSYEEIVRFVRAVGSRFELSKVHITGGEPLVRPGIADLVAMLAAEGVSDLALTTNGQLLAKWAGPLKRAGLQRVNVSLDSVDAETYASVTRGGDLATTVEGIDEAQRVGLAPIKLNTVVLRGRNDHEVEDVARFALERGCAVRFLELMPIGCARDVFEDSFVPASEVRARLESSFRLAPTAKRAGRSSRDFVAEDGDGRRGLIGFISAYTRPFCRGCGRLRLSSTGRMISCLARGEGVSVRQLLRENGPEMARALQERVGRALAAKSARPKFISGRPMATVGG